MRLFALLLLLAGCVARAPDNGPLPLRNPTAPLASQVDATPQRLSGDWVVVQGAGMRPGAVLRFEANQIRIDGQVIDFVARQQGRFTLGGQEYWVYWLDADDRTAAIGDPDGRRVWIMDRTGKPGERLRAAREILDWYGYDLNRLTGT